MKNLGIDVGGVIISRANDNTDTSFFSSNFLQTTPEQGAFEAITETKTFFAGRYIVSKCGNRIRQQTLDWFEHHNFYDITGIPKENVFFCRKRFEKAGICKDLGITTYIDDRLEILTYMFDIVDKLYLFKPQYSEIQKVLKQSGASYNKIFSGIERVDSWKELILHLRRDSNVSKTIS